MALLNTAQLSSKIQSDTGEQISVTNKSNIHRANKVENDLDILKTGSKTWALAKDKVTISTTFTNNTNLEVSDFTIKDTLSEGASFVAGSVKVDSVSHEEFNPIDGFSLSATVGGFGSEMDISYEIEIDPFVQANSITNSSAFSFNIDNKQFSLNSNTITIKIMDNEVFLLKTASASAVKEGDVITYTIEITNEGEIENTDLFFTDPIPEGTTFVEGSVKIDDVEKEDYNPVQGFKLDNLPAKGKIVVEFKVQVN